MTVQLMEVFSEVFEFVYCHKLDQGVVVFLVNIEIIPIKSTPDSDWSGDRWRIIDDGV